MHVNDASIGRPSGAVFVCTSIIISLSLYSSDVCVAREVVRKLCNNRPSNAVLTSRASATSKRIFFLCILCRRSVCSKNSNMCTYFWCNYHIQVISSKQYTHCLRFLFYYFLYYVDTISTTTCTVRGTRERLIFGPIYCPGNCCRDNACCCRWCMVRGGGVGKNTCNTCLLPWGVQGGREGFIFPCVAYEVTMMHRWFCGVCFREQDS